MSVRSTRNYMNSISKTVMRFFVLRGLKLFFMPSSYEPLTSTIRMLLSNASLFYAIVVGCLSAPLICFLVCWHFRWAEVCVSIGKLVILLWHCMNVEVLVRRITSSSGNDIIHRLLIEGFVRNVDEIKPMGLWQVGHLPLEECLGRY